MNAMLEGAGVKPAQFDGPVVTRAGKGVVYRGLSIAYEFLGTTAAGKQMSPIVGVVHARRIHGPEDFVRHSGRGVRLCARARSRCTSTTARWCGWGGFALFRQPARACVHQREPATGEDRGDDDRGRAGTVKSARRRRRCSPWKRWRRRRAAPARLDGGATPTGGPGLSGPELPSTSPRSIRAAHDEAMRRTQTRPGGGWTNEHETQDRDAAGRRGC